MKYTGSCHCGEVRYEVMADIASVISCNCSICSRKGHLLAFAPADNFTLLSGESFLSDYQFNQKNIHHLFCKQCGISSFGRGSMPDGTKMVSINVCCLENVDYEQFPVTQYNGKDI